MVVLSPIAADQVAVLLGAIFGAMTMALIPYWNTIRNNEALGLPAISFDKKFLGTMLIALGAGVVAGLYYFNTAAATIDTTQTVIQLFATAAIASAVSNRALNSLLTVSNITTTAAALQKQNEALIDEINVLKVKITSVAHPSTHEVKTTHKEGAPVIVSPSSTPTPTTQTTEATTSTSQQTPVKRDLSESLN